MGEATDMSDYLPHEVLLEILHRLPVKSLIRFRCVSKSWNSLITCPAFINSHFTQSPLSLPSNSNTLIVRSCNYRPNIEYYKLIHNGNGSSSSFDQSQNSIEFPLTSRFLDYFKLIGSVNGLFSICEEDRFFLWNPSIRKCITLPKPRIRVKTHSPISCRLGFGFDPRTNDYKVVRIVILPRTTVMTKEDKPPLVEVYSLHEGCWRITRGGESFPSGIGFNYWLRPVATLNGAVHFEANDWDNNRSLVLSFDLGDEVFRVISLPNGKKFQAGADIGTAVFKGLLSLICYDYECMKIKCCSVWVMKEYGAVDSWTKQFTIDLNSRFFRVLGFWKNGHILVETRLSLDWNLCSYDPASQQVKNLGFRGSPFHSCADNYVENLILLDKPNDAVSKRGVTKKRKCR